MRENSETFGKSITVELNSSNGLSAFISSGLGHGFQALDDMVAVTYLLDKKYDPAMEFGINPLDKDLDVNWKPMEVILSEKDSNSSSFSDLKSHRLG